MSEQDNIDENMDAISNYGINNPAICDVDELSLWLQNASTNFSSIPIDILNDLLSFEVHSSFPQHVNRGEIPCSEAIIDHQHRLEMGRCSGTKEGDDEDCPKDVLETSDEYCRRRKRTRSTELHNLNGRLRRQKLKEKVNALQEMIPNCNKRDIASTLDDAIKYINTLQYQLQMMSIGAGFSMFCSPLMMMPQPGQQGIQIPYLAPFLQTGPLGGGTGIGMGISDMFSPFNFPMCQLGLPNQHLLTSLATSGLPAPGGISAAAHSIQYPGNVFESLPSATSSMDLEPLYATYSGFQSTIGGETGPSQGALSCTKELCPIIPVISEKFTKRGSTRVLPSKIVLPRVHKEFKDYGSSHSGSSEWSSGSTAR